MKRTAVTPEEKETFVRTAEALRVMILKFSGLGGFPFDAERDPEIPPSLSAQGRGRDRGAPRGEGDEEDE